MPFTYNQRAATIDSEGNEEKLRIVVLGATKVGECSHRPRSSKRHIPTVVRLFPGKTCLCRQFVQEKFLIEHQETVDEMHRLELPLVDGHLTLEILDTAGIEEFPVMRRLAIAHGDAFLILYAVNDPHSFSIAEQMLELVRDMKSHGKVPLVIVANKSDLQSNEELKRIVEDQWHCPWVETCSSQRESVINAFRKLLQIAHVTMPMNIEGIRRSSDPNVSISGKKKICIQQ